MADLRMIIVMTLMSSSLALQAQQEIPLYTSKVPNSKVAMDVMEKELPSDDGIIRIADVSNPVLYAYFPEKEKNTGKAIIIFPGGGYGILAIGHEGHDVAKKFASVGISAFVVKYRLPNDELMVQKEIGPLQDAQRAIQMVREQAEQWNIDPDGIGIAGFSAGGHLASTAGTHYQRAHINNPDQVSLRPDFILLVYPVISMQEGLTHKGSQVNLLGSSPSQEQLILFSNEMQVSADTPPTFLIHAQDDTAVPIANSSLFKQALEKVEVPVEWLVYPKGGHGFGLNNPTSDDQWFPHVVDWISRLP